jgi:2,4-dienoyl-CoA reductase-like NADH-dependent reductase (Old Yellow Enzyme family)
MVDYENSSGYTFLDYNSIPIFTWTFKVELIKPCRHRDLLRSLAMSECILENGIADYIAMSRPFIKEPDLVNRWKSGQSVKSECKSDNRCFRTGFSGHGIACDSKES